MNLVSNAVKFTDKGQIDLIVRFVAASEQTVVTAFEVRDTGIGIPTHRQKDIFNSFTQAADSTSRLYGGTGLGTTIARELTELMGGELTLKSTEGLGSVFTLRVPLKTAAKTTAKPTAPTSGKVLLSTKDEAIATAFGDWLDGWSIPWDQSTDITKQFDSSGQPQHECEVLVLDEAIVGDPVSIATRLLQKKTSLHSPQLMLIRRSDTPLDSELFLAGYTSIISLPLEKSRAYTALHACLQPDFSGDAVAMSSRHSTGKALRILVADDNEINADLARLVLEKAGHKVIIARDGEQTLDKLEEGDFDVVVVDMQLPGRTGPEVIKLYRFMTIGQHEVPFLVLTADARHECKEAGADGFLTKPFDRDILIRVVEQLASRGRQQQMLTAPSPDYLAEQSSSMLIDEGALDTLMQISDSSEFVISVIERFFQDTQTIFDNMSEAAAKQWHGDFRDYAHALRGNATYVGAVAVASACKEIMSMDEVKLAQNISQELDALRHLFRRTEQQLENYLKGTLKQNAL